MKLLAEGETPIQMFYCKFYEIFKNDFFIGETASES